MKTMTRRRASTVGAADRKGPSVRDAIGALAVLLELPLELPPDDDRRRGETPSLSDERRLREQQKRRDEAVDILVDFFNHALDAEQEQEIAAEQGAEKFQAARDRLLALRARAQSQKASATGGGKLRVTPRGGRARPHAVRDTFSEWVEKAARNTMSSLRR